MTISDTVSVPSDCVPHDLAVYADLLRLRRFEEKAGLLYALGTLEHPCPLGIGQEAAWVALARVAGPQCRLIAETPPLQLMLALGRTAADGFRDLQAAQRSGSPAAGLERGAGEAVVVLLDCNRDLSSKLASVMGPGRVAVIVVPRDQWPGAGALPAGVPAREIDAADFDAVAAALAAAQSGSATGTLLVLLTPPYVGHARSAAGKAPSRHDVPDPVRIWRSRLIAAGACEDVVLGPLEGGIRDEIHAAARLLTSHCTD